MQSLACAATVAVPMLSLALTPVETRILGCLIEKERTTPENYPLSLHSLVAACNQATARDPVAAYDASTVERGLDTLREKKLATVLFGAGSRVQKYRHNLLDHFTLGPGEIALLCVLLLRGPQTSGELRARTERLHRFGSSDEVETVLRALSEDEAKFVQVLPARPGQKERRYVQLFSEPGVIEPTMPLPAARAEERPRIEILEQKVAALRRELDGILAELETLKNATPPL
jgi:uncharacterized protein YceH (UPF0502 family)